jgi:hypothetical protein
MRIFPIDEAPNSPVEEPQAPAPEMPPIRKRAHRRRLAIFGVAFILIVVFILAVGVAFFVLRYYEISKARSAIEPLVQNVTLRTSNDINYDVEPSKITYKELFEKLDKDLSEIESKKIDLQTISSTFDEQELEASLNYMKSCQGLLRALESRYYKQLAYSTALETEEKALTFYSSAGYYGRYYTYKTYKDAVEDVKKKEAEYNESMDDVSKAIVAMGPARTGISKFVSDKSIVEDRLLTKLSIKNFSSRTTK